jgi:hypothetical protein
VGIIFDRPIAKPHVLSTAPVLESWGKTDHPEQLRLRAYLDKVETLINALVPVSSGHLALELTVGLSPRVALDSGGRDLDNYLLPIARRIGPQRLDTVFGRKLHTDTSTIAAATATQVRDSPGEPRLLVRATGSSESSAWKQQIHGACRAVSSAPLPRGPLTLCIRFGVSSRRNWSTLWKPSIDALGPVLGIQDLTKPFRPENDRIVELALHRTIDDTLGNDVDIEAWWSHSVPPATAPP